MAKKETSKDCFARAAKFKRFAELDPTSEQKAQTYQKVLALAQMLLTDEMKMIGLRFEARNEGSDWYEVIKLQYPITDDVGKYTVTSAARDWHETRTWTFDSREEALWKVSKLVNWIDDNRKRGHGDREEDLDRLSKLEVA